MSRLFLYILNGSLAAGWVVLGVLLLRLLLRRSPKWILCLLWGIVALRLLVPIAVQSSFSLLPSAQVIPVNIDTTAIPAIESGISAVDSAVNPLFTEYMPSQTQLMPQLLTIVGWIWLAGVGVMLLMFFVSWLRLRLLLRASLRITDNVYVCDYIDSPFVFGVVSPRIYLPSALPESRMPYVLAHEQAHIRRKDHWWKPLGYLLLSAHWFNPLLWIGYILLCRDIEQACDDKVIKTMSAEDKRGYSEALLGCSQHHRMVAACPVAFGEVGVKTRIRGILNYKKPSFWVLTTSVIAVIVAVVCFLTNPVPCNHTYESAVTRAPTCTATGVQTQLCSTCGHSYTEPALPIAHTYDQGIVTVAPTCIQTGTLVRNCTHCGKAESQVLAYADHTVGQTQCLLAATCVSEGQAGGVCQVCHQTVVTGTIPACNVHDLAETVIPATCTTTGRVIQTCNLCGYTKEWTLDLKAHDYQLVYRKKPTCRDYGMEEWVCADCKHSITRYDDAECAGCQVCNHQKSPQVHKDQGYPDVPVIPWVQIPYIPG